MPKQFESKQDAEADERLYKAPALEKGLDILELVAAQRGPMTLAEIVRQLDRSTGELFRMIQVLEFRGFLERAPGTEGYRLTDKLFSLSMNQPTVKGLIEVALPCMRQLSQDIGQSCHLVMHSRGQMVVVARMEASEDIGFSVRVGYRRPLISTLSGAVLYAFQNEQTRERWARWFDTEGADYDTEMDAFIKRVNKICKAGFGVLPSNFVAGITDLSAPICRGEFAAAALTVPFVKSSSMVCTLDEAVEHLSQTAATISSQLVVSDART